MKHTLILSFVFLISLFFNLTAFLFASYPAAYAATHIQAADSPADPLLAVCSSQENPAAFNTFITWRKLDGAVSYELELWTQIPPATETTAFTPFFSTKNIYVNGYNVNLPKDYSADHFYWHVRALNLDGTPISPWTNTGIVYVDKTKDVTVKPIPTSHFNQERGSILLYPVYTWIPVNGADKYEVEILNAPPENPNGNTPSAHRIATLTATGFDAYDTTPRISSEPFYWRVRALDENGEPISVYSDASRFIVNPADNFQVATFGDSITHGGGSLSYSPADLEFSYQHFLDFPTINLGLSGDTSAGMLERFDRDVVPFHPQYLIILGGTNSLRGGVPAESVIADLKAIEEKCIEHNIQPILLTLPPINPDNIQRAFGEPTAADWQESFAAVNTFIRTQPHIDLAARFQQEGEILPTALALDGIHMDTAGKKLMAEVINENWTQITSESPSAARTSQHTLR